jgi:hypothetical protein
MPVTPFLCHRRGRPPIRTIFHLFAGKGRKDDKKWQNYEKIGILKNPHAGINGILFRYKLTVPGSHFCRESNSGAAWKS